MTLVKNAYIYILVMALVTYAVRMFPLALIRVKIKSQFLRSFLYYVPYVTLSVMTFPAIIEATNIQLAGVFALVVGIICAYKSVSLLGVSLSCCLMVLVCEFLIPYFSKLF